MSKKEERERLLEILRITGSRKGEFAKKLEVSPQAFNFYLNGKNDYQVITRKLSKNGVSIDWLYTGKGNPVFQPEIFEDIFGALDVHDEDKQKNRVINWILTNYESISDFEVERNIKLGELESVLFGDEVIMHDLLVKLDNSGMNIKWSIDGMGSMYNDNTNGRKLSKRLKK